MYNKLKGKKQILNAIDVFLEKLQLSGLLNSADDAKKNILNDALFYNSIINYFKQFNTLLERMIGTDVQKNKNYDVARSDLKKLKEKLTKISLMTYDNYDLSKNSNFNLSKDNAKNVRDMFIGNMLIENEVEESFKIGYVDLLHDFIKKYYDLDKMKKVLEEYRKSKKNNDNIVDEEKNKKDSKFMTIVGKSKEVIKNNGKKIIIGSTIVVLATGITLIATHCNKEEDNQKDSNNPSKPSSSQSAVVTNSPVITATPMPTNTPESIVVPTSTPEPIVIPTATPEPTPAPVPTSTPIPTATPMPTNTPEPIVVPTATPEPVDKMHESAIKVYESWSKITSNYSVNDIENVIKALYGLDSPITLDEADAIIMNVIELAAIPRINNILMGTTNEVKQIDVTSLLQANSDVVQTMQNIFNSALVTNNLEDSATKALKEEVLACEYGSLNSLDAASKIIWARLAIYVNAIHGTLGSDFYIEYNGKIYSQGEMLESNIYEEIISKAKNETYGKR